MGLLYVHCLLPAFVLKPYFIFHKLVSLLCKLDVNGYRTFCHGGAVIHLFPTRGGADLSFLLLKRALVSALTSFFALSSDTLVSGFLEMAVNSPAF